MNTLACRAAPLALAIALSLATTAHSQCNGGDPCPGACTIPNCVKLLPGLGDPYSNPLDAAFQPFNVVIRSATGAPVPFAIVTLDFGADPDIAISDDQLAVISTTCAPPTLSFTTDAFGVGSALFRGGRRNPPGTPGPGAFNQVMVLANGIPMKLVNACTPSQNSVAAGSTVGTGYNAAGLSYFRYDLFNYPVTAGRSDLNCSGFVDPADSASMLDHQFNDVASSGGVVTFCP